MTNGGYDEGYRTCSLFWGKDPGSLIKMLPSYVADFGGLTVWDIGCGEGKNAIHLSRLGASVDAWDVSKLALENARKAWPDWADVNWKVADARKEEPPRELYDLIIMYGVLHCFKNRDEVREFVVKAQERTRDGGLHVLVAFNSRWQELHAHPNLNPTLLDHEEYIEMYNGWRMHNATDSDLYETHPHNRIPHHHSLTRLIAERV